jgi:phage I-like protein
VSAGLLDAVDEMDRASALCRALDMALENDASEDEEALRQLLTAIELKIRKVREAVDVARKTKEAPAE